MAPRWLKVAVPVLAVSLAAGGYLYYAQAGSARPAASNTQQVPVKRGTIEVTVNTSGSVVIPTRAQAKLSFGVAGTIVQLPLDTGDEVKKGQILAKLDTSDLERDVLQAESNLKNAQLALEKTRNPYTPGDIAKAEANVSAAKANLAAALSNLDKVKAPYTEADIAKQQASVSAARSNLRTAQTNLDNAKNPFPEVQSARSSLEAMERQVRVAAGTLYQTAVPTAPDVVRAHDALFAAISNVDDALDWIAKAKTNQKNLTAGLEQIRRNDLQTIQNETTTIKTALTTAEQSLVTAQGSIALSVPLARGEVDRAQAVYEQTKVLADQQQVSQTEVSRKGGDLKIAQDKLATEQNRAAQALARAVQNISTLTNTLEQLYKDIDNMLASQADPADIELKQSQVLTAQANVKKAEEDLAKMLAGADPVDVQKAESQVASARASLKTAEEDLDKLKSGGDPTDIQTRENQVTNARVALDKVKDQISKATIVAPFDGVVVAVNTEEGMAVSASTVVVQLVDPGKAELRANVDEVDVLRLRPGQSATLSMDALPGVTLGGKVRVISYLATQQSGVVTYEVTMDILPLERSTPTASSGRPGQRSAPTISGTRPPGDSSPQAAQAARRTPTDGAPAQRGQAGLGVPLRQGLTVLVTIIVERRENALTVPQRAVRQVGRERIVKVLVDGQTEERRVRTGVSDGQNVEILEGLQEGDIVLIEAPARSGPTTSQPVGLPGGFPGGAIPGGGIRR